MAVKFNETLVDTGYFEIDGMPYQKGSFNPKVDGNSVGIYRLGDKAGSSQSIDWIVNPTIYSEWTNQSDTPYASLSALIIDLKAAFFLTKRNIESFLTEELDAQKLLYPDGLGKLVWESDNVIKVRQNNISTTLGGVIESTKAYLVTEMIDTAGVTINVPDTGLTIIGYSFDISGLFNTEAGYTMFSSLSSGNVLMADIYISVSGLGSSVYDLKSKTGFEAIEVSRVNYTNCSSLGDLDNFRQGLETGTGRFEGTPELTLTGIWIGGYRITESIVRDVGSSVLFKEGVGLVINGRFISDINMEGETNATFLDFISANIANDSSLEIHDGNFRGVINASPNILYSDIKASFKGNIGLQNTYVGAQFTFTVQSATDLTTFNPNKLAGTTSYVDQQWWSNSSSNSFTYDSTRKVDIIIQGTLSITGGANDQVSLIVRQWDDSASSYIDLSRSGTITINAAGRAEGIAILGYGTVVTPDRIEIWVENETDTSSVTALLNGLVSVSERPN